MDYSILRSGKRKSVAIVLCICFVISTAFLIGKTSQAQILDPVEPSQPFSCPAPVPCECKDQEKCDCDCANSNQTAGDDPPAFSLFGDGTTFEVSGYQASYSELEKIVFHPRVIEHVERKSTLKPPDKIWPVDFPNLAIPNCAKHKCTLRDKPRKVFDVFMFGNELDLVEIRVAELSDLVERFFVAESPYSFGLLKKPLYFARNVERFEPWLHQITSLVVDTPNFVKFRVETGGKRQKTNWAGELEIRGLLWHHVLTELKHMGTSDDDVVLWSDMDDIPTRDAVNFFRMCDCDFPVRTVGPTFRYNFQLRKPDEKALDCTAYRFGDLKDNGEEE